MDTTVHSIDVGLSVDLQGIIRQHGLVNIWFEDAELMREIQASPPTAPYVERFVMTN
ncbi:MAG: hypothetical protein P4L84_11790 [Isosphaeraceae bacterium]|nr:hypothetical protein [Isosphaeraceae bacterium]